MNQKALVTSTEDKILVIPLISDACLSCQSGCSKQGKPFPVSNPNHLSVKKGQIINIGANKTTSAIQGIIALIFPICCSILGFILSNPVAALFHTTNLELVQVLCVLTFFFAAAAIVFLLSRFVPIPGKPVIISTE